MPKPSLKQLTKLLRSYRNDGLVNIRRKDNITTIRAMHEDHASMITCAQSTEGPDYDEFVLENIEIHTDEIRGDKKDIAPLKIAHLPDFCDHLVNVELIGRDFADPCKKHAAAMKYKDPKTGNWTCHTRFDFRKTRMVLISMNADLLKRETIVTRQIIPETGRIRDQCFDTVMLTDHIFKHLIPESLTVQIQGDKYPLELTFWVGPMQCYYIQSPRLVIE